MPIHAANKTVMSLKILAETAIVSTRAREMDFLFLKVMSNNENCPEFKGTIHKYAETNAIHPNLRQKQCILYISVIDMTPSYPDTIMTALRQAQQVTSDRGHEYVVFTADLQLYKVAVNILWAYPE